MSASRSSGGASGQNHSTTKSGPTATKSTAATKTSKKEDSDETATFSEEQADSITMLESTA